MFRGRDERMNQLTIIVTIDEKSAKKEYVEKCLESVRSQSQLAFEAMVLAPKQLGFSTSVVPYEESLALALQQAVATVTTPYVTIVDGKDWLEPHFVEDFYESLRTPEVDIILGGYTRFFEATAEFGIHIVGEATRTIQSTKRLLRFLPYLNTRDESYRRLGNTFIKTTLLQQVTFPDIEQLAMEEDVLRQVYALGKTVLYHHQANYIVRILPEKKSKWTIENLQIHVRNIPETLTYIQEHHASVARFGDGEFDIMRGHSIPYQTYDAQLAAQLCEVYQRPSDEQFVVCQSDVFERLDRYTTEAQKFWRSHLQAYQNEYRQLSTSPWYGSTFISRPYIDLADKSVSAAYFEQLKSLWQNQDILIVEGELSRSGVGNDLFDNAASITRIIGPSRDAYAKIDALEAAIRQHGAGKLILLMLGPTAKILSYRLFQQGYWAIDLGHIDSEYEWFNRGATTKVKLYHKHTAEHNYDEQITLVEDHDYETQIVEKIQ